MLFFKAQCLLLLLTAQTAPAPEPLYSVLTVHARQICTSSPAGKTRAGTELTSHSTQQQVAGIKQRRSKDRDSNFAPAAELGGAQLYESGRHRSSTPGLAWPSADLKQPNHKDQASKPCKSWRYECVLCVLVRCQEEHPNKTKTWTARRRVMCAVCVWTYNDSRDKQG